MAYVNINKVTEMVLFSMHLNNLATQFIFALLQILYR